MKTKHEYADFKREEHAYESSKICDEGGDDKYVEEEEVKFFLGEPGAGGCWFEERATLWAGDAIGLVGFDAEEVVVADGTDGV